MEKSKTILNSCEDHRAIWRDRMKDLVSIITPAYNCSFFVGETIRSVLSQTYDNWEMIIVDDASTDNTLEVIKDFAKNDSRIKVFSLEKNGGSAAAKNYAISLAKGRYLAFLDSDDLWKKTKLEKQIGFMEKNNYPFTFTAYEFMKDNSNRRHSFDVPKSVNYRQYLGNTIIGNSTVVLDRNVIDDICVQNGYLEDALTWMHILKRGFMAYGLNEVLMDYRVRNDSKSGKKTKNAIRYFKVLIETQNLNFLSAIFYEISYLFHAVKKRVFARKTAKSTVDIE